jgi:hypothetical protein
VVVVLEQQPLPVALVELVAVALVEPVQYLELLIAVVAAELGLGLEQDQVVVQVLL